MHKALEMGKKSATGSFQLFIGMAASTIIMAIGTIILGRLMMEEEYGLYSAVLTPSYMIILFRDWGVNSAITRYTAYYRAQREDGEVRRIIKAGMIFEIATGLSLSIISLLLAGFIASTINRPEATPFIAIASITIFSGSILIISQSTFVGFERMGLNSATTILQAVVKSVVSPTLVFLGYSVLGAVLGYTISLIVAAIISIILLYVGVIKKLETKSIQKRNLLETLKTMLRYGVPISVSAILAGFLVQFYALLMIMHCTDAMIGNYKIAVDFAIILTFFTTPISTVLFPAFSKVNARDESELLKTVFASSVKYTSMLLVPATMAMMVLSKPIIGTLYGEKYTYAPFFLTLYVISNLFAIFGSLSLGNLLAGLGETKTLMTLGLVTFSFGIPMALILIPTMGIIGLILTTILAGIPRIFLGLYWIWKRYKAKVDIKSSTKILAASVIATATTFLILNFITSPEWIELVFGGATFLAAYLITAPLIGAINTRDINNLKTMFSGLRIISKLLNIPLNVMEKLTKTHEQ